MQKTCALLTLLALCALTAQGVAVQDPQLKTNEDASIPAAEAEDIPRYRLPNHNSAELCIPDEAIQPRNVGYNLAWIGWQSNICLFVSNEDKYGYIRNVNKEQCPSSQAILDDYVQDHPYPNYTKR
ncbi:hypothetical protein RI367_005197 [Sorochytrium milnesiophthora]